MFFFLILFLTFWGVGRISLEIKENKNKRNFEIFRIRYAFTKQNFNIHLHNKTQKKNKKKIFPKKCKENAEKKLKFENKKKKWPIKVPIVLA